MAAALMLGAVARIWSLDRKNLWLDEAASWNVASGPLAMLLPRLRHELHPPAYYALLHGWIDVFGASLSSMRALSVVFGIAALVLAWRLARMLLPPGVAVAALVWLAVSPHMVAYAQEARGYSAATAAVLGACLAYRSWIHSAYRRTAALACYAACLTAALYLHYFTVLIVPALCVHLFAVTLPTFSAVAGVRRRVWQRWSLAHVIAFIAFCPWLPSALAQLHDRTQPWREPIALADLPWQALVLAKELLLGPSLLAEYARASSLLAITAACLAAVVVTGAAGLLRACLRKPVDERALFLALVCAVPAAIALALLTRIGWLQLSRYLVYLAPLVLLATARGLSLTMKASAATLVLAIAIVTSTAWLGVHLRETAKDSDVRPIVAELEREIAAAGGHAGTVLAEPSYFALPLEYYGHGLALAFPRAPTDETPLRTRLDDPFLGAGTARVWVVIEQRSAELGRDVPDARLSEIEVPGNDRARLRLYRVRPQ